MKHYTTICIFCLREKGATQIDQLPIPNTNPLFTKGWIPVPKMFAAWVNCNILREHVYVNKENYVHGQITLDGQKVIPKI